VAASSDTDLTALNIQIVFDPAVLTLPVPTAGPLMAWFHTLDSHSREPGRFEAIAYAPSGPSASWRSGPITASYPMVYGAFAGVFI
jgi:hypothetical protein